MQVASSSIDRAMRIDPSEITISPSGGEEPIEFRIGYDDSGPFGVRCHARGYVVFS